MARAPARSVFCLSLGCSKNTVDSERLMGAIAEAGYKTAPQADGADVAIVNTCGFIRPAVEESIGAILDLVELKSRGSVRLVGVVGCLVARYGGELRQNIPEVDFWAGCEEIAPILKALSGGASEFSGDDGRRRLPGSSSHVRYLKISEGCSAACSYCTIPAIRGPSRSRAVGDIVGEAAGLARDGAVEICLVAQDLTSYGADRGENDGLVSLLDELETSLPGDLWLRLLYLQPSGVSRALLERVAGGRQVLPYLDIPIQHSAPKILNLMNRVEGSMGMSEIFETAREIRPDFALRTTCMVGFPGESRSDFEHLLRFLEKIRFDRVGAFAFSPEEGTVAEGLPGQVPKRTGSSRLERLMAFQADISLSRQALFVGRELDVLIDSADADGTAEGRSFREAPDVDGVIELVGAHRGARPGDRVRALVTDASEHDLAAEIVAGAAWGG
ncbi:MAG: 30S ribosomal protein S12 methylthiotransferase RimO [Synergistaceae bacterium]|jgi:ribosomal protein S12 methylthiotransferase|nr:30S ribosomal protein S12 methylthiotransferase RimO [Synergistaceae bacterium]